MPTTRSPLRLDADLVSSAGLAASSLSRSTAQQITHWARIGRELERSPSVSLEAVAEALAGAREYDALSMQEQSVVRAFWAGRMAALRKALRLDRELAASGHRYAELDDRGSVVVREPRGRSGAADACRVVPIVRGRARSGRTRAKAKRKRRAA